MGFIESVGCKAFHFIINGICGLFVNTTSYAAVNNNIAVFIGKTVNENVSFLFHYGVLFLAHCTAHNICSSEAVTCKSTENLHYLFLIDNTAVGYFKNFFEHWVLIAYMRRVVSAVNVGGDTVHRSGTVKRKYGNQILNAVGF